MFSITFSRATFVQLIGYYCLYIKKIYFLIYDNTCSYLFYPTFRETIPNLRVIT